MGTDGQDQLALRTDGTTSSTLGELSIVGDALYVGNGSGADPIGSVDATHDGTDGATLWVNFTSVHNELAGDVRLWCRRDAGSTMTTASEGPCGPVHRLRME